MQSGSPSGEHVPFRATALLSAHRRPWRWPACWEPAKHSPCRGSMQRDFRRRACTSPRARRPRIHAARASDPDARRDEMAIRRIGLLSGDRPGSPRLRAASPWWNADGLLVGAGFRRACVLRDRAQLPAPPPPPPARCGQAVVVPEGHVRAGRHGLHSMRSAEQRARSPSGLVRSGDVEPKMPTVGRPSAPATCMAPESLPAKASASARSATSSPTDVSPAATSAPARHAAATSRQRARSDGAPTRTDSTSRAASRSTRAAQCAAGHSFAARRARRAQRDEPPRRRRRAASHSCMRAVRGARRARTGRGRVDTEVGTQSRCRYQHPCVRSTSGVAVTPS